MISRPALRLVVGTLVASAATGLLLPPFAAAEDATIAVVDNAFQPREVTVTLGDELRFSWQGDNRHGVRGPWGESHAQCSSLATRTCANRGDAPFVYVTEQVGTFQYACQVHSSMSGSFTVIDAPSPSPTETETSPPPTETPGPSPTPSPTPAPTTTSSPSPTPSPTPVPSPSPSPSPTAAPSAQPSAPAVVVPPPGPRPSVTPTPSSTLEPFLPSVDPDEALASELATERAEAAALLEARRHDTVPRIIAFALVLGTLVAFVQYVLLGPEWIPSE